MGGKWKPLILYQLRSGSKRFGDLRRLVAGISEKVLIQQLRELVEAGIVVRRDCRKGPPKVDYAVTAFGETLVEVLPSTDPASSVSLSTAWISDCVGKN